MKSWIAIAALSATMINADVGASPPTGADAMCSENSIALSLQWSVKEARRAKELSEALPPEPEKQSWGWRSERNHLLRRQNWLTERQNFLIANQSAIAANEAMESLILLCDIRKRLGMGV